MKYKTKLKLLFDRQNTLNVTEFLNNSRFIQNFDNFKRVAITNMISKLLEKYKKDTQWTPLSEVLLLLSLSLFLIMSKLLELL